MDDVLQLAKAAGRIADGKKAEDITILDLRNISTIADVFIICTVTNTRQAKAIVQEIEEKLTILGSRLDHIEGYPNSSWILMDYTDIVIHIFTRQTRDFYDLEHLWGDAPRIDLEG